MSLEPLPLTALRASTILTTTAIGRTSAAMETAGDRAWMPVGRRTSKAIGPQIIRMVPPGFPVSHGAMLPITTVGGPMQEISGSGFLTQSTLRQDIRLLSSLLCR
jgi:hypothetical protein